MFKKKIISLTLLLILSSCNKSKEHQDKFTYRKGSSSVELKILNGKNYLVYNKSTRVNFEWKNIDPKMSSIYGAGIKILELEGNNTTKTKILVPNGYLKKDTLNIKLNFKINGKNYKTEFNIPIIKEEN
ncbi:conserved hypothetical protein [Tenacibaculum sp. 190524A02b]|uniref:Lipoprotein n=1 Tax=Tenacibaculum vairaonense TaxID=3137860 RepID=A0ABP1FEQ2_9FLAO